MTKKTVPCPACRKPAEWEGNTFRPFCSKECKFKDLGKWATEAYRVPVEDEWEKEDKPGWKPVIIPGGPEDED